MNSIGFGMALFAVVLMYSCQNGAQKKGEKVAAANDSTIAIKAMESLTAKIQQEPENAENYYNRAQFLMEHNNVKAGIVDVTKALQLNNQQTKYYLLLADMEFSIVQTRNSKEALERCLQIDPKNKEAFMKLAELYIYVKQYNKSIEYVDNVLRLDVHNPKAYFLKGMSFKFKGDTAKAISSFQTVVEQNPQYYDGYMQLGLIFAAKKSALALQYLGSALRIDNKSTEALYARAMYYQQNNMADSAISDYKQIVKISPGNKEAYYNQAYVNFYQKQNYKTALELLDQAIHIDAQDPRFYYLSGLSKNKLGQKQAADKDFKQAKALNPAFEKLPK